MIYFIYLHLHTTRHKAGLYRDLSYGEILAGRPGAWLVKKKIHMHAIKKVKKGT